MSAGGSQVLDACHQCRSPSDPLFSVYGVPNIHVRFSDTLPPRACAPPSPDARAPQLGGCVGCDGQPHSRRKNDSCGVCGGNGCSGNPAGWGKCCDCAGVPFGTHVQDGCCNCVSVAPNPNQARPPQPAGLSPTAPGRSHHSLQAVPSLNPVRNPSTQRKPKPRPTRWPPGSPPPSTSGWAAPRWQPGPRAAPRSRGAGRWTLRTWL